MRKYFLSTDVEKYLQADAGDDKAAQLIAAIYELTNALDILNNLINSPLKLQDIYEADAKKFLSKVEAVL